jgi:hypothetical protein
MLFKLMYLALFVVLCNKLKLQFLVHLYPCHGTIGLMFRLGRSQQHAQWIWLSTLTTMNTPSPGTHQHPTLMSWLPCATSASPSPTECLRLIHACVLYPTLPYTFPCLFPIPAKPTLFRAIKTPVLVSYWSAQWSRESPAVSFCPTASQWEALIRTVMTYA